MDEYGADLYKTAVQYLMFHSVGVVAAGAWGQLRARAVLWLFLAGILFFCGSLIGLALGGPRWLGAVAPIGGTAFILGWLVLARSVTQVRGVN